MTRTATLAALALLAGAAPALAQNALGDGRGLERDLRVGGSGNYARPDFMNEVRARNALVTGNAGAGASLRINPGYTAPDEFRGQLGSDDLFRFRRDSIQSSPGFRGTQGLQYQSAYSIGNSARQTPIVTRLDQFSSGNELPRAGYTARNQFAPARVRSDNPYAPTQVDYNDFEAPPSAYAAPAVGTLRSTSAFTSTIGLAPAVVGMQLDDNGLNRFTASSLRGLRDERADARDRLPDNRLTARELAERNNAAPANTLNPDLGPAGPNLSAAAPAFRTSYDDLRLRLNNLTPTPRAEETERPREEERREERPAPEQGPKSNIPDWERRINDLRERLREGEPEPTSTTPERDAAPVPTDQAPKPGSAADLERLRREREEARVKRAQEEREKRRRTLGGLDDETIDVIKKGGGEAKSYTTGTPGSLFDVHVREGEDALAKGRYFDAEERFARALAMRPGDVTVMSARMNAQIGAGLYLSAAVNLRQLLETHPEVIAVKYTGNTMPAQTRLTTLKDELRRAIDKARNDKAAIPEESALLLAYIGYQTTDRAAVREGLDTLAQAPSGARDPLLPVLRRVWLEETTDVGK
ncbi:MAG TPA: hypothetical protein VD997_11540 [Phycisphaerales bacterium]|nr:hypothetical protein [Phycisphaerales bacterium]